jgi:hypothetical protein
MRYMTLMVAAVIGIVAFAATVEASTFDGTLKLGGISVDEQYGDLSSVQETYNIYDGFNVTQVRLNGVLNPRHYFTINLRDINLKSRKGDFLYRIPGTFKFSSNFRRHRQVFDPDRAVTSNRKMWRFGASLTPTRSWEFIANYSNNQRSGSRLSYPSGTNSWLGDGYDYTLQTGGIEAMFVRGPRGFAVRYDVTDFVNQLDDITNRRGHLVSARINTPCFFYDKWTHLLRGAYGKHEVINTGLDYTLLNFQYTGVVLPVSWFKFKYNLFLNRVDDQSTMMKTDNIQNNFDGDFYYKYGRIFAGYGYEINDDDRSLTNYNTYRLGGTFDYQKRAYAKLSYANRAKTDREKTTLLQDIESEQVRADLKLVPMDDLVIGGKYVDGTREFPDINVKAKGQTAKGYLNYKFPGWVTLVGDYTYGLEEYDDRVTPFNIDSQIVTGRLTLDRISNLMLAAGVAYVKIGKDLDIEKSIVFFEGEYTVASDYHIEVKYNIYNYDDFIITDRYYTANVVWVNFAYDFRTEI